MKYNAEVIDLFENPRWVGRFDSSMSSVFTGMAGRPSCCGIVQFQLRLDANRTIEGCRFMAFGCPATVACAEALARMLVGMPLGQAAELKLEGVIAALGLPSTRDRSARVACAAVERALVVAGDSLSRSNSA